MNNFKTLIDRNFFNTPERIPICSEMIKIVVFCELSRFSTNKVSLFKYKKKDQRYGISLIISVRIRQLIGETCYNVCVHYSNGGI